MMKNLFKFFILLNAILIISIHATCPNYPTIPTSSPMLITPASTGMSNFITPTQQLSVTIFLTPTETCTSGTYNLFSISVGTEYFALTIDCSSRALTVKGSWLTNWSPTYNVVSVNSPMAFFFTFDLATNSMRAEFQSETYLTSAPRTLTAASNPTFNGNTKFYLCADKDGSSPKACTISNFIIESRFYGESSSIYSHLGVITDPTIAAFYPLSSGLLETSIGSASPVYFGDKDTDPTEETKPTWDSSNKFVQISAGQFLSVPIPDISSSMPTLSKSFSFSAWLKITDLPVATTTLFAIYSATGTQVGYKLTVVQSSKETKLRFGTSSLSNSIAFPTITLDQWQLIGFTASLNTNMKSTEGMIFVGTSWTHVRGQNFANAFDLSTASVIRIGDSTDAFSGDISIVRIMTGGGIVRTTDLCSPDNSMELGVGSFPLACSGAKSLNGADNACIDTCPGDSYSTSDTGFAFCVPCPNHCTTCDSTECKTCEANYLLYQGDCLDSCPDGTYSTGSACESCPTDCKTCESSKCLTCETNYLLYQKGCVASCPGKTYSTGSTCKACSVHCADCEASGCKTCSDSYQLNTEKKCELKSSNPGTPGSTKITTESSGLSGGAIAGIVCGGVASVGTVGFIVFHLIAKKFPTRIKGAKVQPAPQTTTPVSPAHTEVNPLIP